MGHRPQANGHQEEQVQNNCPLGVFLLHRYWLKGVLAGKGQLTKDPESYRIVSTLSRDL